MGMCHQYGWVFGPEILHGFSSAGDKSLDTIQALMVKMTRGKVFQLGGKHQIMEGWKGVVKEKQGVVLRINTQLIPCNNFNSDMVYIQNASWQWLWRAKGGMLRLYPLGYAAGSYCSFSISKTWIFIRQISIMYTELSLSFLFERKNRLLFYYC